MKRAVVTLTVLSTLAIALAFFACSSDDSPIEPEPTDPAYIWAGNGRGGLGDVSNLPRKTRLYWPQDVMFAPDGQPIVIDWNNHRVIAVDESGEFQLVVGAGSETDLGDPCPTPPAPCVDILAIAAPLNHPTSVAYDPATGNMVLCAWHNSALFLLDTTTGLMDRFCGTGARPCFGPGSDPQPLDSVCVDLPSSVIFDPQGRLCFTDQGNHLVRRIDLNTRIIETIAGTQPVFNPTAPPPNPKNWVLQFGYSGDGGPATQAKLQFERGQIADPSGKICFDALGNMYIADTANHAVRVVDTNGIITRFAGAAPVFDSGLNTYVGVHGYSGDGGPATSALLYEPRDVAVDFDGTLFIADTGNNVIRMVRPNGNMSTVMGVHRKRKPSALLPSVLMSEDGASAKSVHLTEPSGVAVDTDGRLWVADTGNNVIRILDR